MTSMEQETLDVMSIMASELEVLKIMKDKNDVMSMKELSTMMGFEIGYTYLLCKSLEKQDCIGFFTRSSCRITAKGKRMVS